MSYLPAFKLIKAKLRLGEVVDPKARLVIKYPELLDVIKLVLKGVRIDEGSYLARYPDVGNAIKQGIFKSPLHHFVEEGYFEGRMPCEYQVDAEWYAKTYADVARGLKDGSMRSPQEHILKHG